MIGVPSATTAVAAVIGSPVQHSLSPAIHNRAFQELGVDWTFTAFDVGGDRAHDALEAMRTLRLGGYAVTTPLKEAMSQAVDEVDDAARNLGSVNTVWRSTDGGIVGSSTDGDGFVGSVVLHEIDPAAISVMVLGAGAAARSIVDGLARAGCGEIIVVNRTEQAAARAAELSQVARVGTVKDIDGVGLVVNATSVGMGEPDVSPITPELLRRDLVVADIVYHPLQTKLLSDAAEVGARTIDGLAMLICQAQRQEDLWVGAHGEYHSMRAAAQAELESR